MRRRGFRRALILGITALLTVVTTAFAEPRTRSALLASSAGQTRNPPTDTVAGFRMEGLPQIGSAFGDIAAYKRRIDEFTKLESQMSAARRLFANASHKIQASLRPSKRGTKPVCPTVEIANSVAAAIRAQKRFEQLGVALERRFHAIRDLHRLGESSGLTPDYRLRALQSGAAYKQALRDLREMSAVMRSQLRPALARHHCNVKALISSSETPAPDAPIATAARNTHDVTANESDLIQARPVAFIVDNNACSSAVRVYVDDTLLGTVPGNAHAAFQGSRGRASLCLLDANAKAVCGSSGTVRRAFLHDGLRLARTCGK